MAVQNIQGPFPLSPGQILPGNAGQNSQGPNTPGLGPAENPPSEQLPSEELAKLEQMQASQVVLDMALENAAKNTETQKETDRAELESNKEPEYQAERKIDEKIWDELRQWRPTPGISFEKNLNQIQNIFQSLLQEIMSDYQGTQQLSLLAQLDAYTMNALQQLMTERFQELLDFLGQYGRPTDQQQIANGLFENISGRKPLTNLNTNSSSGGFTLTMQNSSGKSLASASSQGLIYQKDSNSIRINESYQNSVDRSEKSGAQATAFLQRGGYFNSAKAFTPYDIKQSQNFIQYLKENYPGIEPGKAALTSEEYLGVSSGILSLKSQTFAAQTGLSPEAASALKYAANTYIQEYFLQSSQNIRQASASGKQGSFLPFQADDFQKIYRYMVNTYHEKKDAQTAVLNGLQKAYERFNEKQSDPAWQLVARYAPGLGFFSRTQVASLEKEMWNGWRAICKDWNEFLQYAQITKDKAQRFDYIQNRDFYLASLLASERSGGQHKGKKRNVFRHMTKWGLIIFLAGIIIFLILRFSL